jgi:hypothetical protein
MFQARGRPCAMAASCATDADGPLASTCMPLTAKTSSAAAACGQRGIVASARANASGEMNRRIENLISGPATIMGGVQMRKL